MWNRLHIDTPYLNAKTVDLDFFNRKKGDKALANHFQGTSVISIFGRNGSGKSTISRAIAELEESAITDGKSDVDEGIVEEKHIEVEEVLGRPKSKDEELHVAHVNLSDVEPTNVFVYNEEFVAKNVRIQTSDDLDAVVMLDNQASLQEEYVNAKNTLTSLESKENELQARIHAREKGAESDSPLTWWNSIKKHLKEPGKYIPVEKELDDSGKEKRVTSEKFNEILNTNPSLTKLPQRRDELKSILESIRKIRENQRLPAIHVVKNDSNNFTAVRELLTRNINKPDVNDKVKRALEEYEQSGRNGLIKIQKIFSNSETDYCPTCFRSINDSEKNEIVSLITEVFDSVQTDSYVNKLKAISLTQLPEMSTNDAISREYQDEVELVNNCVKNYNAVISEYKLCIEERANNPYLVVKLPTASATKLFHQYVEALTHLSQSIITYNSKFDELDKLVLRARTLNKQIARTELSDEFSKYIQATNLSQQIEQSAYDLTIQVKDASQQVEDLHTKMKLETVALNDINDMLASVFMDKTRLTLKPGNDCYHVLSHGEAIPVNRLSMGEQNAISLCYFFSKINANQSTDDLYKHASLIVLDDPISSFDFENKVGILSLIRDQLGKILFGNEKSRIVLMTHDREMFDHLNKVVDDTAEFKKTLNKENDGKTLDGVDLHSTSEICGNHFILNSGVLVAAEGEHVNDYANDLRLVYSFAEDRAGGHNDVTIGNIMRRVLEAYASFNYSIGPTQLFNDIDVLKQIHNEPARKFFSTLMYRLVLNSQSHFDEVVHAIPDSKWQQFLSHDELVKTARIVISFLFEVNRVHLKKLINGFDAQEVETWQAEIPGNENDSSRYSGQ